MVTNTNNTMTGIGVPSLRRRGWRRMPRRLTILLMLALGLGAAGVAQAASGGQEDGGAAMAGTQPVPARELPGLRGRGSEPVQPVGQAPSAAARQQPNTAPVSEQSGVLTPRGHFVLEPSLEYQYTSNSQVALIGFTIIPAITVGYIDIQQVKQTTVIGALTGRYGITNRLELDVKVPYVYRNQQSVRRPVGTGSSSNSVFDANGHDIGDTELALRYQFNQGGPSKPYFIGSLRAIFPTGRDPFQVPYNSAGTTLIQEELPTGSGFYGIQPGFTVIFPSDPAVFFGGVNYLYNFSRNVDTTIGTNYIGDVQPGDQISANFGMGLALNDRSSVSLGYQHTFIEKTRYNGSIPSDATNTQLGQLLIGYSYTLTPKTSFNLSLGAGLTQDTPDVSISLRMPIMF